MWLVVEVAPVERECQENECEGLLSDIKNGKGAKGISMLAMASRARKGGRNGANG